MSAKHRISYNMNTPFRLFGLTVDEILIAGGGLFSAMLSSTWVLRTVFFVLAVVLLVVVKRLKKRAQHFNMRMWLWWHFGIGPKDDTLPPPHTRRIG